MAIARADPGWLAQRATADDAARSTQLAAQLAALMPPGRVLVHDLGAGTGAMTRWLAPRLPGPQRWVLHDGDAGILRCLDLHAVTDDAGRPIVTATRVESLASLPPDAFHGAAAVTASALLDVITADEAARVVAACVVAAVPALFSLSVTGEVRLEPLPGAEPGAEAGEADVAVLSAAFNDHQRRDAGGRRMLGPDAVRVVAAGFAEAGWAVRTAATPWRLGPDDARLIAAWLHGWIAAAVIQRPLLAQAAGRSERRWGAWAASGLLRVTVSHEDLLAWPG